MVQMRKTLVDMPVNFVVESYDFGLVIVAEHLRKSCILLLFAVLLHQEHPLAFSFLLNCVKFIHE